MNTKKKFRNKDSDGPNGIQYFVSIIVTRSVARNTLIVEILLFKSGFLAAIPNRIPIVIIVSPNTMDTTNIPNMPANTTIPAKR